MKFKIPLWLKLAVSVGLLIFLFKNTDLNEAWRNVRNVPPTLIFLVLFANLAAILINSYRWAIIIPVSLTWQNVRPLVIASYLGTFYSVFLPSALGGDVIKWGLAGRPTSRARTATSILIDRLVGLISSTLLSLMALASLYFFTQSVVPTPIFQLVSGISLAIAIVIVAWSLLVKLAPNFLHHLPIPVSLKDPSLMKVSSKQLFFSLLITFFNQLVIVSCSYLLVRAFNIDLNWFQLLLVTQLSWLVAAIPISFGGFGTTEISFVFLANLFGALGQQVLSIVSLGIVMHLLIIIFSGIIGWVLFLPSRPQTINAK